MVEVRSYTLGVECFILLGNEIYYPNYGLREPMTIDEALVVKKYGGLTTWRELFYYMRHCGNPTQFHEIWQWAARYNRKEKILLPLRLNLIAPKPTETVSLAEAEAIFVDKPA